MAIAARLDHDRDFVSLEFYPDRSKAGVIEAPDDRDWPIGFNYDDDSLMRGQPELLGLEVLHIGLMTDAWLRELDKLDLPRVDVPEIGLYDARLSAVLRWARAAYRQEVVTH